MERMYDFSGWCTKANLRCSDGRTILKDAFKNDDGAKVPLVWNHQHNDPHNVLGHALLENKEEGVYAYCKFNDSESGKQAKELVKSGDVSALSIYANRLKQQKNGDNVYVVHGAIREVSLVLAGANPGAYIDSVLTHSDEESEEATIYTGEDIVLFHSEEDEVSEEEIDEVEVVEEDDDDIQHADDAVGVEGENEEKMETLQEIFDTLTDKQKTVVYAMLAMATGESDDENVDQNNIKHSEGENETMKYNVFENDKTQETNVLSHSDMEDIIKLAKSSSVGSFQDALNIYAENNSLKHGIDEIESLFPDYRDVKPGAPELIERDQGWVSVVMSKTHKSPISRIRTRQADVRDESLRALGYKKGDMKKNGPNFKLLTRTTDPQTVYRKDFLNRDDIVDITDFDVVAYQYDIMKQNLNEEIATAIMIGDGREDGDANKIEEVHIRSIWNDDELYTIHADVDVEAMRTELTGTNNSANFGENYVYAEAIIQKALYAREKFKGSGTPDFFCTPHLLNVMLLARDLNGRRIYDSKSDLAAALNVNNIYTCEQFEGKTRTTKDGDKKKLLGIFVNLVDYYIGSTKGGEITKFNQFDIDFNQEKYLIETRISGALTKVFSAIALEEPVKE